MRDVGPVAIPGTDGAPFAAELACYRLRWPDEAGVADAFAGLLAESGDADAHPFLRARLAGHFTGSAGVVDGTGTRTLLTHHRKLDRWLQLGGHADGVRDLCTVALQEAQEESGLRGLTVDADIFDLDRHRIPEHKGVPAHWHYDVRYVVRTQGHEDFIVSDESHALAWRDIAQVAVDDAMDPSLRRMARKWLAGTQQIATVVPSPSGRRCPKGG